MPDDAPGGDRLGFSRSQRLRHSWEFERARREGRRLVKGCLILNWRLSQEQTVARLGIVASRKIGNAVVRSRARRLLREVFRLHQHELDRSADIVLIARNSIAGKSRPEVEKDFVGAARQAALLNQ